MAELIDFANKYSEHVGKLPASYYHLRTNITHGFVPSQDHMQAFLDSGEVYEEQPWGRIQYKIPQPARHTAKLQMEKLSHEYQYAIEKRRNQDGRVLGQTIHLFGNVTADRGRPVVIGIADLCGNISRIHYTRRNVFLPEMLRHKASAALLHIPIQHRRKVVYTSIDKNSVYPVGEKYTVREEE